MGTMRSLRLASCCVALVGAVAGCGSPDTDSVGFPPAAASDAASELQPFPTPSPGATTYITTTPIPWPPTPDPPGPSELSPTCPTEVPEGGFIDPDEPIRMQTDYFLHLETVEDFVVMPEVVVVGEVVAERRGVPRVWPNCSLETARLLTVSVQSVLAGPPPSGELTLTTYGWREEFGVERTMVEDFGIRLEVGDRAVMALNPRTGTDE